MNDTDLKIYDADGLQLFPNDRVVLLRSKHKDKIAVVKRTGRRTWKYGKGRIPRECAVVNIEERPWGPFGILSRNVRLIERHKDNMARVNPETLAWLKVYRFSLEFYFIDEENPEALTFSEIGAMVAATTSSGFEVWRAIRPGKKLIDEIGDAVKVCVTIHGPKEGTGRKILMNIGEAEYLPFGVGVELGGRRVGRLDATENEIALEGVVFRHFEIVSIEDKVTK